MQILLAADEAIAVAVQTSGSTIYRTKKRFVEISLEAALSEEPRPGAARALSSKEEAQLVALACSDPPKGCARWTLKLLANGLAEVTQHPSASRETHAGYLQSNRKRVRKAQGVPPKSCRPYGRPALGRHRPSHRNLQPLGVRKLLRRGRLRCRLNGKCSSLWRRVLRTPTFFALLQLTPNSSILTAESEGRTRQTKAAQKIHCLMYRESSAHVTELA
jgi:hypothetical protein